MPFVGTCQVCNRNVLFECDIEICCFCKCDRMNKKLDTLREQLSDIEHQVTTVAHRVATMGQQLTTMDHRLKDGS